MIEEFLAADVSIQILIPGDLAERIDYLAARQSCSPADLIRSVLPGALRDAERLQDVIESLDVESD